MQKNRKRLITNYSSLTPELMELVRIKYPLGWINSTIKVPTSGGNFFYAITLDTDDTSYLIKVPVKIDTKSDKDEDFFDVSLDMKDSDINISDEGVEENEEKEKD